MKPLATMRVGVVVERRPSISLWCAWSWTVRAITPARGEAGGGLRSLREDGTHALFHAGEYLIELHRADADGYKQNLSLDRPMVYVAVRPDTESDQEGAVVPYLVTASPDEAQACMEGDDAIFPVAMPQFVAAWLAAFVEAHDDGDVPLKRRKRKGGSAGAHGSAPETAAPAVARRGWEAP